MIWLPDSITVAPTVCGEDGDVVALQSQMPASVTVVLRQALQFLWVKSVILNTHKPEQ